MRFLLVVLLLPLFIHAQIVTTIAGNGISGLTGDGGPATLATLMSPNYMTFDKFGNCYYSDIAGHKVTRIDVYGVITTVAGTGVFGFSPDGIAATTASVNSPRGIACDSSGDLYIADEDVCKIRKVNRITGIMTTVAGTGVIGFSGDGGPATSAKLRPTDIHFDSHGNLIFSDFSANRIRKIDLTGIVTTVGGNGICGFAGDGGPATNASICGGSYITIDDANNIYITDEGNKRIRKINSAGTILSIAGTGVSTFNGEGIMATTANINPSGIAVYNGLLFLADDNCRIRMVTNSGLMQTIAGTGFPGFNGDSVSALSAKILAPRGCIVDTCGSVFFSDLGPRIRKVTFPHCNYLGLGKVDLDEEFRMFPNPSNSEVTIIAPKRIEDISLVNLTGREVLFLKETTNRNKVTIDVSCLPSSIYFVKLNGIFVGRLLKE